MRILHILNHVRKSGNGIVNVAVDLACLQAQDGYEVAIASAGGEYEALLKQYKVQHITLDQTRKPINLLKAAQLYREILRKFQPNIVHAHMMTGVVLAKIFQLQTDYALVSTVHNEFQKSSVLMGWADRVIAVSKAVARSLIQRGIREPKLRIICNGTLGSPRTERLANYLPLQLEYPAITTVAGMYYRKGIIELIDAFTQIASNFPDTHLYLIGDGPDRLKFESKASNTTFADRIHFEGFQAEPQRYLLSTDIFVLASHREPFGLVLSEAREAGCAIVASNVDGIPEALDNGEAGILVPAQNSKALAQMLAKLLKDQNMLHKWKTKAKNNLDWLSVKRVHEETLAVYRELNIK